MQTVNLFPWRQEHHNKAKKLFLHLLFISLANALILTFIVLMSLLAATKIYSKKEISLNNENAGLEKLVTPLKIIEKEIKASKEMLLQHENNKRYNQKIMLLIAYAGNISPSGLVWQSLEVNSSSLRIVGIASVDRYIEIFRQKLSQGKTEAVTKVSPTVNHLTPFELEQKW